MTIQTPEWIKDAIFYQIFPDRFASSRHLTKPTNLEAWDAPPTERGFKGGDFVGMTERLDYLVDLGVNAIYFNPIFQSTANHRYHTHDYYRVDPVLGGNRHFKAFLGAAHARGIRVMLDGVFNHASRGFLQFNHLLENGEHSPYLDWFIVEKFPLHAYARKKSPNYACWWDNPELPKLNTDSAQVREFLYDVAVYWLEQGIDAWRLDVPLEIETPGFWEEFRRRVKSVRADAYILAEIWDDALEWLQGEHFDAVMNYNFNRACYGFFGNTALDTTCEPGGFAIETLDGPEFSDEIDRQLRLYDWDATLGQYNLLSSHDEPRFLTLVGGDTRRLRLATLFQMIFPGPPSIYYGDEIGMEGGDDPDCRRAFPWDEARWDHELRADFKRFIGLRHEHTVLRRGRYASLHAEGQTYACARFDEESTIVAAFNAGAAPAEFSVPLGNLAAADAVFRDLLEPGREVRAIDGRVTFALPPLEARVLKCAAH